MRPFGGRLLFLLAGLAACSPDRPVNLQPTPANGDILRLIEEIGFRGPVAIVTATPIEDGHRRATKRSLMVPPAQRDAFGAALRAHPAAAARLTLALQQADEITDPNQIDSLNNTRRDSLQVLVAPSILNRPASAGGPVENLVQFSLEFLDIDPNGNIFFVPGGDIDSLLLMARIHSAGHYHGDSLLEDTLPRRVGRFDPRTGSFTTAFQTTWHVPEFSQEINHTIRLTERGGPNDGQTRFFFNVFPYASRVTGLHRIPPGGATYVRTGGTTEHPEDFNDWAVQPLIDAIVSFATAYNQARGDVVRVNDLSLFFGGRFDVGRASTVNGVTVLTPCHEGDLQSCWGNANGHQEHRLGTEADLNLTTNTLLNRAGFYRLLLSHFQSVYPEGNHWHVRDAASIYNPPR